MYVMLGKSKRSQKTEMPASVGKCRGHAMHLDGIQLRLTRLIVAFFVVEN